MENLTKAIQVFEDSMNTSETTNQNLKIIHPPAPAPPAPQPLPSFKDFNNVGFIGIHEIVEDNAVKEKMENLRVIAKKSLAVLNLAADAAVRQKNYVKTDKSAWIGLQYFPLLRLTETVSTSLSLTTKGIDVTGKIFSIIKGFNAKEDSELTKFCEHLGKIARSFKPLKYDRFRQNDNDNDMMVFTYSVDISKIENSITYQPTIKQFSIKLNNDLSGIRCQNNSDVTVNITISCSTFILDYDTDKQQNKDQFHNFLNRYGDADITTEPAHFEGYFRRA
ncbi:hypothetical protein ACX0HA_00540 [Flavobacterium hauense]